MFLGIKSRFAAKWFNRSLKRGGKIAFVLEIAAMDIS